MLWQLKDFLFPGCCTLCGDRAPPTAPPLIYICDECRADLPWLTGSVCQCCSIPTPGNLCGECLLVPPRFTRCHATFRYRYPLDRLMAEFKNHANLPIGESLASLVTTQELDADMLVPVPLHRNRIRQRGFNQAELISRRLSKNTGIPTMNRICSRTQANPQQKDLDRKARMKNVRGIFTCQDRGVAGKRIVIVDDVVTTGATVNSLAGTLLAAGASRVEVCCIARTEKGHH